MPSNSLESDIKKATAGNWVAEEHDWVLIFDICSRVTNSPPNAKSAFQALMKRLRVNTPEVQFSSLVVLETISSNCGKPFHLELCSRDFYDAVFSLYRKRPHAQVMERLRLLIEEWTSVFGTDTSLAMMQKLYTDLKKEGFPFSAVPQSASSGGGGSSAPSSSAPQPSSTMANKEQDDLSRAIALSLQDSQTSSSTAASSQFSAAAPTSSMYPTLGSTASPAPAMQPSAPQAGFKARALYDFNSEDDNEVSFKAGELINVFDNSDENWWSGSTLAGSGLFPASFVTRDLTVTPEPEMPVQKTSSGPSTTSAAKSKPKPEIREEQISLLLDMLRNADATVANEEEENTLKELEGECGDMKPLIADEITSIDRERQALQDLNQQFQDALAYYQQLIKDSAYSQSPSHAESAPPVPSYCEEYGYSSPAGPTYTEPSATHYTTPPAHHHAAPPSAAVAAPSYHAAAPPATAASPYYAAQPPAQAAAPAPAAMPAQVQADGVPAQQAPHGYAYQAPPPQHQQAPQQQPPGQVMYQEQAYAQYDTNGYMQQPPGQPPIQHQKQQPMQAAAPSYPGQPMPDNVPYHAVPPAQVMPDGSLL